MMASTESLNLAKWLVDSNEVLNFRLVHPDDAPEDRKKDFHPEFSWLLFEEEKIFGYKEPKIDLFFASGSLRPYFRLSHADKIGQTSAIDFETTDIKAAIDEKLTLKDDYCTDMDDFMQLVKQDEDTFEPSKLGSSSQKVHEYSKGTNEAGEDRTFEIYKFDFDSRKFRSYHKRLQTFLPFFIDGARFIDDADDRWEIYVTFEKMRKPDGRTTYDVVGYSTCYPFFYYSKKPDLRRMRISQFIVLPPYQKNGHGSGLYRTIYRSFLSRPEIAEITVEDPNDDFTDMRDVNDLKLLVELEAFKGWERSKIPSKEQIAELGKNSKLSKRQLRRMAEIWTLKMTNPKDSKQMKAYRMWVKGRIYNQNKDVLATMTLEERREKVQEAYEGLVEQDYRNILNVYS